ncbi:response regulator [Leptolyngbya sp. AN03gr2]|uniref:response regulator n=1 Tax=unclassified Leptolyngbya TaxID=2650499 RepID=UPI003D3162E2
MKILVIEDDELTAQALTTVLTTHHYVVEIAETGKAGLALLDSFEYDLLILDVGLPDLSGIEVCQQIRSNSIQLPILLLTAHDSHHDRVLGLDAGADDYLVKPFDEEELVARIRALFRRANAASSPILEWEELQLNPSTCEVQYHATPLILTPKEYALLELFLRNGRRVFSCSSILEHLWTYEDMPGEEAVRTHIKGLRQKLKSVGAPADLIETVYGIGYRLKPLSSASTDSANPIAQELRSKLNAIWNSYKDRANQQIGVIEQVVCQANLELQAAAAQQAHTLAGSLGTFGFPEGSQIAKEIELLLTKPSLKAKTLSHLRELVLTLRRVIDLPTSANESICSEPTGTLTESRLHQPLILIVSRDRTFIELLKKEILLWGYQSTIASTLKNATKLCENESPSLVLLDLDCFDALEAGLELLSTFQNYSPAIPTIVLTARNDLAERLEVARRGGRLLLDRSTPTSQILDAIAQIIQRVSPTQAKVLVVDDDVALLNALTAVLQPWGLQVFTLSDPHRFWNTLETVKPDIVVLDLEFPDVNGIELCQVVRSDLRWNQLPIVILTAHSESETIAQVFAAGADDFVSKPIVEAELVARLLNRLERVKLLRQLLEIDPLTGVTNRRKSTQELEAFFRSSEHSHQPIAIAVIDVDHLRDVNAEYGHAAGDVVLRQLGHLLRQSFCSEDVVARWGGEEFVIGMYGMTREAGVQRLIRVLEHIDQHAMRIDTGETVSVTFSAGVAQYPEDGKDLRTLYRVADLALRQAKQLREKAYPQSSISSILPAEPKTSLEV